MSALVYLFRPERSRRPRVAVVPPLAWLHCPACGAKLGKLAVEGRAVVELRCPQRGCRRIVTLTREAHSGTGGVTRILCATHTHPAAS